VASEPVGWWGIGRTDPQPSAGELGLRIRSAHWRRGLGTEGVRVLLDHAFGDRGLARIWAGTASVNTASRRTLEAVGLRQTDEPFPGVLTYEITRSEWPGRAG
jgi:RimJ/RimL family protein N-acetyltransferase